MPQDFISKFNLSKSIYNAGGLLEERGFAEIFQQPPREGNNFSSIVWMIENQNCLLKATGEGGGEDVNISNDSSSSVSSHHPSQLQVGLEKEDDALQEVKERLVSVEVINILLLINDDSNDMLLPGREGQVRGGRVEAGGGAVHHSRGQQDTHCVHCHSHHR